MSFMNWFGVIVCVALFSCTAKVGAEHTDKPEDEQTNEKPVWKIENGKFYRDGEWGFLKIAKPLRNFADGNAVQQLINDLDKLKSKHYNVIVINCYWHHFDHDGAGVPDVSLEPLNR